MGLPLQPTLRPVGRWWRVLALVAVVVLAAALPSLIPARRSVPQIIVGGPGRTLDAGRALERHLSSAQTRLWVAFYVVRLDSSGPVAAVLAALEAAAQRGVDVRVVLDRGRDGDDKNDAAAAWLTAHGLHLVWDEVEVTTHAKVILADDVVWIGSHNATRAALSTNREAAVILDDPSAAAEVAGWFEAIPGFK